MTAARHDGDFFRIRAVNAGPYTLDGTNTWIVGRDPAYLIDPGHAPDHLAFLADRACFTGDAVLGSGSVFVAPLPGAMVAYLDGIRRIRALGPGVLCPGHGPMVDDPRAKLDEYLAHREGREQRLLDALQDGLRSVEHLLDRVWSDAPDSLRTAAAVTLEAHLDKLAGEGRLPAGVERRDWQARSDALSRSGEVGRAQPVGRG